MREILADAAALAEDFIHRRRDGRRAAVESEIVEDARGEMQQRVEQRPRGRERFAGVVRERAGSGVHVRRIKEELAGLAVRVEHIARAALRAPSPRVACRGARAMARANTRTRLEAVTASSRCGFSTVRKVAVLP